MTKPDRKRVLAVVGSPRRGGNTDLLVEEMIKGAREAGAEVEKVYLGDLRIAPCKACLACEGDGECVQKDDMTKLYGKMRTCGVWILGTPVYWWGPSAQLKAFVDRWFAKTGGEHCRRTFGGKRVLLAVPMGDTNPKTGRHVVGMFKDAMDFVKAELFASVLAPGANDAGDVSRLGNVLRRARRAGRDAVAAK